MLSIVIPAFNEEERIKRCLKPVIEYLKNKTFSSEIIVVCDGCTDRTSEVVNSFKQDFPGLKIIEYTPNKGKGFAVKKGMLSAEGDYILFMDADYAVPIKFLDKFLKIINYRFDIVIGSRGHVDTKVISHQAYFRELAGKLFGRIQKLILRIPYYDTQCGFKLFTQGAARFLFPKLKYDCSYFDAELIYIAYRNGLRICEAPIEWNHDGITRMPIGVGRTFDLIKKLIILPFIHRKDISINRFDK